MEGRQIAGALGGEKKCSIINREEAQPCIMFQCVSADITSHSYKCGSAHQRIRSPSLISPKIDPRSSSCQPKDEPIDDQPHCRGVHDRKDPRLANFDRCHSCSTSLRRVCVSEN